MEGARYRHVASEAEVAVEESFILRNKGLVQESRFRGYTHEIHLPNGHVWRRNRFGKWCRFSDVPKPVKATLPGIGDPPKPILQRAKKVAKGAVPLRQTVFTKVTIGGRPLFVGGSSLDVANTMAAAAESVLPPELRKLDRNMVAATLGAVVSEGKDVGMVYGQLGTPRYGAPAIFESGEILEAGRFLDTGLSPVGTPRLIVTDFMTMDEFKSFITVWMKHKPNFAADVWKSSYAHSEQALFAMLRQDPDLLAQTLRAGGVGKGAKVHALLVDLFTTRMMCSNCLEAAEVMTKVPELWRLPVIESLVRYGYIPVDGLPAQVRAIYDRTYPTNLKEPPLGKQRVMGAVGAESAIEAKRDTLAQMAGMLDEIPSFCVG